MSSSSRSSSPTDNSSATEICIYQIKSHLEYYERERNSPTALPPSGPSSLATLAADRVVQAIREDSTAESVQILLDNCPPNLLATLFKSHSIPYDAYRRLGNSEGKELLHIDEWVFENERMMRRLPESQWGKYLVTLAEAESVWPESEIVDGVRVLTRKNPPREHMAILGDARERRFRILKDTAKFKQNFQKMTGGVLEGLDWENVFVAGGMPLGCLMCVEPAMEKNYIESDIDLYIYGLNPEEANKKAVEIFEVWSKNLGPDKTKFVVRNAKTYTFISDYPKRRVQIILKLVPSPAGILLNFDLDQCAIGWNGAEVLMLPRCARALETGYSVFTSDLIHGHYLGDRRATQEKRVFKYADKGFGILFLSRFLETTVINFEERQSRPNFYSRYGEEEEQEEEEELRGKKAVARIAYVAKDTVHRFYIGPTEVTALLDTDGEMMNDYDPKTDTYLLNKKKGRLPLASYSALNGREQHIAQPGGRSGLKKFETFMRMVTMWTYDRQGMIRLNRDSFESTAYGDLEGYDDFPTYIWNQDFKPDNFARKITDYNDQIFSNLKPTVYRATQYSPRAYAPESWKDYLTRRLRRIVTGSSLSEVLTKQITIPVWIPQELDTYLGSLAAEIRATHNLPDTDEFQIVIPGVSARRPAGSNPPPPPSTHPWTLKIWVIGNTTSWARLDRRLDEVFEMLWTIYHVQAAGNLAEFIPRRPEDEEFTFATALRQMFLRRRASKVPSSADEAWPDAREKRLWTEWLMRCPTPVTRHYNYDAHDLYQEDFHYKPQEGWYWNEDLAANDGGVWRKWGE